MTSTMNRRRAPSTRNGETSRGSGRRRVGRWALRVVAALAVLAVVGAGLQAVAERRDAAAHPPPGQVVELADGRHLHLQVQGLEHDGPVVVLETGMGGFSAAWAWIQPTVAEHATVVSYDRPGLGWSDPSPNVPDAEHVIDDLRSALDLAGLSGRGYVLVGHSLGGHYARVFAQAHPDEVAGMVLVDPSHERQTEAMGPEAEGEVRQQELMLRAMQTASRLGLLRLHDPLAPLLADLPEPQLSQARAAQVTPDYFAAYRAEFAAMEDMGEHLAAGDTDLDDLPLIVLMAGSPPEGASRTLIDAMNELRAELAELSTNGSARLLADAEHLTIVTDHRHAEVVADTIVGLVEGLDQGS
jgi:pimeloyl-ACP methyl ester carboxylesterase